jgi:hypothetical protein
MRRVVGAGVRVTTDPYHLRDFNRFPTGVGEREKAEMRSQWDREYEESWGGETPSKEDYQVSPMVDTYAGLTQGSVAEELAALVGQAGGKER